MFFFLHKVLDLSYNNLSSDGILSIGLLPRLKVLHLTGNDLQMLLPDMAGPNTPHGDLYVLFVTFYCFVFNVIFTQ